MALLETIYRLLGGDPRELDQVSTAQAVFIVSGYYNANGIPQDLTREEREELRLAVADLSAQPLPLLTLGPQAAAVLVEMLLDMTAELAQ